MDEMSQRLALHHGPSPMPPPLAPQPQNVGSADASTSTSTSTTSTTSTTMTAPYFWFSLFVNHIFAKNDIRRILSLNETVNRMWDCFESGIRSVCWRSAGVLLVKQSQHSHPNEVVFYPDHIGRNLSPTSSASTTSTMPPQTSQSDSMGSPRTNPAPSNQKKHQPHHHNSKKQQQHHHHSHSQNSKKNRRHVATCVDFCTESELAFVGYEDGTITVFPLPPPSTDGISLETQTPILTFKFLSSFSTSTPASKIGRTSSSSSLTTPSGGSSPPSTSNQGITSGKTSPVGGPQTMPILSLCPYGKTLLFAGGDGARVFDVDFSSHRKSNLSSSSSSSNNFNYHDNDEVDDDDNNVDLEDTGSQQRRREQCIRRFFQPNSGLVTMIRLQEINASIVDPETGPSIICVRLLMLTSHTDYCIRIWDTATAQCLRVLRGDTTQRVREIALATSDLAVVTYSTNSDRSHSSTDGIENDLGAIFDLQQGLPVAVHFEEEDFSARMRFLKNCVHSSEPDSNQNLDASLVDCIGLHRVTVREMAPHLRTPNEMHGLSVSLESLSSFECPTNSPSAITQSSHEWVTDEIDRALDSVGCLSLQSVSSSIISNLVQFFDGYSPIPSSSTSDAEPSFHDASHLQFESVMGSVVEKICVRGSSSLVLSRCFASITADLCTTNWKFQAEITTRFLKFLNTSIDPSKCPSFGAFLAHVGNCEISESFTDLITDKLFAVGGNLVKALKQGDCARTDLDQLVLFIALLSLTLSNRNYFDFVKIQTFSSLFELTLIPCDAVQRPVSLYSVGLLQESLCMIYRWCINTDRLMTPNSATWDIPAPSSLCVDVLAIIHQKSLQSVDNYVWSSSSPERTESDKRNKRNDGRKIIISKEIPLDSKTIPFLIGRGGANITRITNVSGASLCILGHSLSIKGSPAQIEMASLLVERSLFDCYNVKERVSRRNSPFIVLLDTSTSKHEFGSFFVRLEKFDKDNDVRFLGSEKKVLQFAPSLKPIVIRSDPLSNISARLRKQSDNDLPEMVKQSVPLFCEDGAQPRQAFLETALSKQSALDANCYIEVKFGRIFLLDVPDVLCRAAVPVHLLVQHLTNSDVTPSASSRTSGPSSRSRGRARVSSSSAPPPHEPAARTCLNFLEHHSFDPQLSSNQAFLIMQYAMSETDMMTSDEVTVHLVDKSTGEAYHIICSVPSPPPSPPLSADAASTTPPRRLQIQRVYGPKLRTAAIYIVDSESLDLAAFVVHRKQLQEPDGRSMEARIPSDLEDFVLRCFPSDLATSRQLTFESSRYIVECVRRKRNHIFLLEESNMKLIVSQVVEETRHITRHKWECSLKMIPPESTVSSEMLVENMEYLVSNAKQLRALLHTHTHQ